jgi:hypothetical protein
MGSHLLRNAARFDQTKQTPTTMAVKVASRDTRLRLDQTCKVLPLAQMINRLKPLAQIISTLA